VAEWDAVVPTWLIFINALPGRAIIPEPKGFGPVFLRIDLKEHNGDETAHPSEGSGKIV